MLVRICFVLLVSLLLSGSVASAQTDDGSLAQMRETWSKLNQSLAEKKTTLDDGDTTPGLVDDYRDLVDQAEDLIEKMRDQGVVELSENPQDVNVIQSLIGIMVHDASKGRDSDVLRVGDALIDAKVNPKYFQIAASLDRLEMEQKRVFEELQVRHRETMANDLPQVKFETTKGEIVFELFENEAPNTVRNFVSLVESGFYEDKLFHRVIDEFIAQTGGYEIAGIGSGGPGYTIDCECRLPDARRHFAGVLSMAHAGRRDTGGSQFFIAFSRTRQFDGKRTVFGRVVSGDEVLESIERTHMSLNGSESEIADARTDRIEKATVIRKRSHSYRFRKTGEPELSEEPVKQEPVKEAKVESKQEVEKEKQSEEKEESDSKSQQANDKKAKDAEMKESEKAESEKAESEKTESADDKKETEGAEKKMDSKEDVEKKSDESKEE